MSGRTLSEKPAFSKEQINQQLDRILDFKGFQASPRRREMLTHIVEECLAGRSKGLKATTIAMTVFGRGSDFDQQADPVVRLEARKLRRDLDNYYATAGRNDPIRISIPKGHYRAAFTPNQLQAETGDTPARTVPVATGVRPFSKWPRLPHLAGVAAGVFVLFSITAAALYHSASSSGVEGSAPVEVATVRVIEFTPRDDSDLSKFLAVGLSHEITAALMKFQDLKVYHLHATYPATQLSHAATAEKSAASFNVRGMVWQEGTQVFVRSEISRGQDALVLWSEQYTHDAGSQSISRIEQDISARIATVAGQRYGLIQNEVREGLATEDHPTVTGYACVARAQIYQRTYADEKYAAARQCLEETVKREPGYARAWAMLAILRNDAARFGRDTTRSREEGFAHAREAASRALTLDPTDPDAIKAMSHIEQYSGNLESSIAWARRAVEANPNDPTSLANLGYRLGIVNRFDEAVPLLEEAIDRSATPPAFYFHMIAMGHMMKGDWHSMLPASLSAVADGSSISFALAAIAHGGLQNSRAAQEYLDKMEDRWPFLAEDPRAALESHGLDSDVIEVFAAGLTAARATSLE